MSAVTEQLIFNAALSSLQSLGFANSKTLALLMVAQSKHETGDYTSNHFVNSNNCFGYSYVPGSKYQVGAGAIADNHAPVAKYASVADSAREVAAWIGRRKAVFSSVQTPEDYASALKRCGYYGDTEAHYLAGLKRWFKAAIPPTLSIIFLIGLAAVSYLVWIR